MNRSLTRFRYYPRTGETEKMNEEMHTGNYEPVYGFAHEYYGNISSPAGSVSANPYGLDMSYTHVLVMDDPTADIREDGVIEWNGHWYEVKAVSPSLNYLSVALKRRTENTAPPVQEGEG